MNAGAVVGSGHVLRQQLFTSGFPVLSTEWPGGTFGGSQTGFIGGGQAGYNWQTGAFVLGAETDFDWTSVELSQQLCWRDVLRPLWPKRLPNREWFAEAGLARHDPGSRRLHRFLGDSRLMIYATGGVAYGGGSSHFDVFDNAATVGIGTAAAAATPASAGPSAAVWNTHSPTTSR